VTVAPPPEEDDELDEDEDELGAPLDDDELDEDDELEPSPPLDDDELDEEPSSPGPPLDPGPGCPEGPGSVPSVAPFASGTSGSPGERLRRFVFVGSLSSSASVPRSEHAGVKRTRTNPSVELPRSERTERRSMIS